MIADDKEGGLMVWGIDGNEVQYVEETFYNNLGLRYNFPLEGAGSGGRALEFARAPEPHPCAP